jgi:hypothetical protein
MRRLADKLEHLLKNFISGNWEHHPRIRVAYPIGEYAPGGRQDVEK